MSTGPQLLPPDVPWYKQLLEEVKSRINENVLATPAMFNFCHQLYNNDKSKLKDDIRDFEQNYRPDMAVYWYTRPTFVFRCTNEALRTENIEQCYLWRNYITDLCKQLYALKHKQDPTTVKRGEIRVYRGIRVVQEELDSLKDLKDSIVSFKQFISTSLSKDVALTYSCPLDREKLDLQPLLLEIYADLSSPEIIAAEIGELGAVRDDNEVLFKFGNRFLVGELTFDNSCGVWLCKLWATCGGPAFPQSSQSVSFRDFLAKLVLYYNKKKGCSTDTMKQEQGDQSHVDNSQSPLSHSKKIPSWLASTSMEWAYILHLEFLTKWQERGIDTNSSEFKGALQTYINYLNYAQRDMKMLFDDLNFAYALNNLGYLHRELGSNLEAVQLIEISLDIRQRRLSEDNLLLAQSYRNLGLIYANLNDYEAALSCHERALTITKRASATAQWSTVMTLRNMGNINHQSHKYSQAAMHYSDALIAHHSCMHAFVGNSQ